MTLTQHARARMSQRGIPQRLVAFALRHGRIDGDRHVFDRNEARRLIDSLEEELRLAKRLHDKGGITVVAEGDVVITTYNREMKRNG
jgi:Domain of unknown function (DUF4258)